MEIKYQEILPLREGIDRWAKAASVAGAIMPGYVRRRLQGLNWDAEGADAVDPYDIAQAVVDAARDIQVEHVDACGEMYSPCPRGVDLQIEPSGCVVLIWRSETHDTSLTLVPESPDRVTGTGGFASEGGRLDPTRVKLCCETDREDSDRLRACRGEMQEAGA